MFTKENEYHRDSDHLLDALELARDWVRFEKTGGGRKARRFSGEQPVSTREGPGPREKPVSDACRLSGCRCTGAKGDTALTDVVVELHGAGELHGRILEQFGQHGLGDRLIGLNDRNRVGAGVPAA